MAEERRQRMPPIPENLDDYLTDAQQKALGDIKKFGWTLAFVRRLFFEHPLVVVVCAEGKKYGVLNEDGTVSLDAVKVREQDAAADAARAKSFSCG